MTFSFQHNAVDYKTTGALVYLAEPHSTCKQACFSLCNIRQSCLVSVGFVLTAVRMRPPVLFADGRTRKGGGLVSLCCESRLETVCTLELNVSHVFKPFTPDTLQQQTD